MYMIVKVIILEILSDPFDILIYFFDICLIINQFLN